MESEEFESPKVILVGDEHLLGWLVRRKKMRKIPVAVGVGRQQAPVLFGMYAVPQQQSAPVVMYLVSIVHKTSASKR